jgi:hypothetical protein
VRDDDQPWWDPCVGKRPLKEGATYESNNSDSGALPPFDTFVFIVVKAWKEGVHHNALVLILDSDDHRLYPPGSVNEVTPAFWIWTGAKRMM